MPRLTNENKLIQQVSLRLLFDSNCIATAYETPWSEIRTAFTLTACPNKNNVDNIKEATPLLKAKYVQVFNSTPSLTYFKSSFGNWIKKQFNLTDAAYHVLFVVTLLKTHKLLREMVDSLGEITDAQMYQVLSDITQLPTIHIAKILRSSGALIRRRLIKVQSDCNDFSRKITPTEIIESQFFNPYFDKEEVINGYLNKIDEPILNLKSYRRHQRDLDIVLSLLKAFKITPFNGCNILLYGEPGTGKTQLSRALAEAAKLDCYEVSYANRYGEQLSGEERLNKLAQARNFVDPDNSLLVFDELEDAIPHNDFFSLNQAPQKRWFNALLESAPSPVIWISNEIDQIDPAFLRRFDYCLKVTQPGSVYKKSMLKRFLDVNDDEKWVKSVAQHKAISVADIERAALVMHARGITSDKQKMHYFKNMLDTRGEHLSTLSRKKNNAINSYQFETSFDPELSNTNIPLADIEQVVKRNKEGRFLLHGVPGTGKTGFVHYLADKLDTPLVNKSASDLLGMFVGENEKAIRSMFNEAKHKKAILLLDEADSFFSDRKGHNSEWRTSMVNEMLVQIERFQGTFFASTNLPDSLDLAVKRRFDFTVSFDYLTPQQISELANSLLIASEQISTNEANNLSLVTPADFAVAARQARLLNKKMTKASLLQVLDEQAQSRQPKTQKIGFL